MSKLRRTARPLGGCGYIGSALVPRLRENPRASEVVVLDSLMSGSPANLAGSVGDEVMFTSTAR